MTTIITRAGKGTPLTNSEMDANLTGLNTDKVEGPGGVTDGHVALFNGTSGKLLKSANVTLAGTNTGDQFTNETASTLLGRGDSGNGPAQEITLGSGLQMTGTVLSSTGAGGGGDVSGPSSAVDSNFAVFNGTTGKIIKEANINASVILGRGDNGAGSIQPITLGAGLSMSGTTLNVGGGGVLGDVTGPNSATNNGVVLFDGASGKLIKDSGLTLSGVNTGDQTDIPGNAYTATKLQTARLINGVAFDGTINIDIPNAILCSLYSEFPGVVETYEGELRFYPRSDMLITSVSAWVTTAPTVNLEVDVKKNGTTIFSGSKPTIYAATYQATPVTISPSLSVQPIDYLTCSVVSGNGQNLVVRIDFTENSAYAQNLILPPDVLAYQIFL